MPIPITCPRCGAAYTVADDLRGRQMLCRECDQPIAVEEPPPRRLPAARLVVSAAVTFLALMPLGVLAALYWTGWLWDYVEWPEFHMAGVAVPEQSVILHVGHAHRWNDLDDELDSLVDGGRPMFTAGASEGGDRRTIILAPVADPEAFARKIDFGTVYRVRGRVITVVAARPQRAEQVTKSLAELKSDDPQRRRRAAHRLASLPPDERRDKAARALEARLDDPDASVRAEVIGTLGAWGTKESVTPLLRLAADPEVGDSAADSLRRLHEAGQLPDERRGEVARALEGQLNNGRDNHGPAIKALGRLKDEASAEPLARCLEDRLMTDVAAEALRSLGPAAEKAVAKRLTHEDFSTRMKAAEVLGDIGTPASIPALRAVQGDFFAGRPARKAIQDIIARHGVAREN